MKTSSLQPPLEFVKLNRVLLVLAAILFVGVQVVQADSPKIWYDAPTPENDWEDWGMLIGNGRLGAILYGNVADERVQFNEDSLWTGRSQWKPAADYEFGCYEPFGEIRIALDNHGNHTNYRRELDLSRGVVTVSYTISGVNYTREYFSSFPDQVMAIRLTADAGSRYSGSVKLVDKHFAPYQVDSNTITAAGLLSEDYSYTTRFHLAESGDDSGTQYTFDGNNMKYESQMRVILDGGTLTRGEDNEFLIDGANSVVILLAADTGYLADPSKNFRGPDPHAAVTTQIDDAAAKGYNALLSAHERDFEGTFGRLNLDLGTSSSSKNALPTDRRIEDYRSNPNDPELEALMAQFGRYLMISSSRKGSLPANLQGLWSPRYNPPWNADYHCNVNLQMNYWLTGPGNLSECDQALSDWTLALQPNLQKRTFENWEGRPGVSCGRTLNIFGGSGSDIEKKADYGWMLWLIWEHYAFTLDRDYLENVALPVIGEHVIFWSNGRDLEEIEPGVLWTMRCQSPESGAGDGVSFAQEVVWELFTDFIEICDTLGISSYTSMTGTETVTRSAIVEKLEMLDWPAVGVAGQLEEFQGEGSNVTSNTHRHISHIAGLFPGRQITPRSTPELADACEVSLDYRTDGGTSWSKAHKASARARLYDGDRAHSLLQNILTNHVYSSMMTSINGYDKFQIDCNFGFPAAVFEMLLQSHEGELDLLPALPAAWPTGSVSGICGRGGFEVELEWSDGKLDRAVIYSKQGAPCHLRYGDKLVAYTIPQGSSVELDGDLQLADNTLEMPPSVYFAEPSADLINIPHGTTVTFTAGASDPNGPETLANVKLYRDGQLVGSDTSAPYTWHLSDLAPESTNIFTLIATDNTDRSSDVATRTVTVGERGIIKIIPVADAYVRGGSHGDNNYGGAVVLDVKKHDDAPYTYDRHAYLRFYLSMIPSKITSATLRLKLIESTDADTHSAYFVEDDEWGESTITYANKPTGSTLLDTSSVPETAGSWLLLDVTDQVVTEAAGDKALSVVIRSNLAGKASYHTKEAASAADYPVLEIMTVTKPTVSFEVPANDLTGQPVGTRIAVEANADDIDGDVVEIELTVSKDGTVVETLTSTTGAFTTSPLDEGTYTLELVATDNEMNKSRTATRTVTVGETGGGGGGGELLVSFDSPVDGAVYSQNQDVPVTVSASGAGGINRVSLWLDGNFVSLHNDGLYEWELSDLEPGTHTLEARAFANADQDPNSTEVTITVVAGMNQPPEITKEATTSSGNIQVSESATLSVEATDPDGGEPSYTWTKVSGPGLVTFGSANEPATTASFSEPGTYQLEVIVSDGSPIEVRSEVTVVVEDADTGDPVISGGDDDDDGCGVSTTDGTSSTAFIVVLFVAVLVIRRRRLMQS